MDDRDFMKMALALAKKGVGFTSPNPVVGAVVVKDGAVVGKGYHRKAGGPHAEVEALRDAGALSKGATLFVTLEPCHHFGRTPPCTRAILEGGIRRVVAAMADPNPAVTGGGLDFLRRKGLETVVGILEDRARLLNEAYIKYVLTRRPFVTAKCAATLDGRLATRTGDSRWVTGPKARNHVHRMRHAADAILVGVGTVKKDDPRLTTRIAGKKVSHPLRIILDTRFRLPEAAKVLRDTTDSDTLIVIGESYKKNPRVLAKKERIEKAGVQVMATPTRAGGIDLDRLMDRLGARGVTSLLIEGGSRVLASAFSCRIVDKIAFFFAPKILGGDDGYPICRGSGPQRMAEALSVERIRLRRFGDDVMIEGYMPSAGKSPTPPGKG